jgi:hypothetical protein
MNPDTSFKHDAINRISFIKAKIADLERDARGRIKEDMAIEYRDLCDEMLYRLDMFEGRYKVRIMPDIKGAV